MKRTALTLGLLVTLSISTQVPAQAATWRWDECRYRSLVGSPARYSHVEMVRTARCAQAHYPVPGGFPKLKAVIDCESGWGEDAISPNGQYRGLMQLGYDEFHSNVGPSRWPVRHVWMDARSNLMAGVRLAHRVGWGPWSCA